MKLNFLGSLGVVAVFCKPASSSCAHGTSIFPRAENGFEAPEFGYTDPNGPLQWAQLKPEFSLCRSGTRQSPINLANTGVSVDAGSAYKLTIADTAGSEFVNLGTTVEVLVNGTLETAIKSYSMKQFHFHTPSEHRVEGEYFPMESHFVFEAADASIAVVAFLITLGESTGTQFFDTVLPTVTQIPAPGEAATTGPLSFASLMAHLNDNTVLRYSGSLTTPPCSEGVDWIISSVPVVVSEASFLAAKKVINFNSRYTQADLGKPNLLAQGSEAPAAR